MSYILSVKPQIRLKVGVVVFIISLISLFLVSKYNFGGFFDGFITGILLGLGLGLMVTYKKTN